jgi:hypothetical protein
LEPMYPPGLPDCFWTYKDTEPRPVSGWLELKYCLPADPAYISGRIPKLRPEQPMFLRRQAENGVPGGILLRVGDHKWLLWKATPSHAWVKQVQSTDAIHMAITVSHQDRGVLSFPELFHHLLDTSR